MMMIVLVKMMMILMMMMVTMMNMMMVMTKKPEDGRDTAWQSKTSASTPATQILKQNVWQQEFQYY